jgi:hypothetical protein
MFEVVDSLLAIGIPCKEVSRIGSDIFILLHNCPIIAMRLIELPTISQNRLTDNPDHLAHLNVIFGSSGRGAVR